MCCSFSYKIDIHFFSVAIVLRSLVWKIYDEADERLKPFIPCINFFLTLRWDNGAEEVVDAESRSVFPSPPPRTTSIQSPALWRWSIELFREARWPPPAFRTEFTNPWILKTGIERPWTLAPKNDDRRLVVDGPLVSSKSYAWVADKPPRSKYNKTVCSAQAWCSGVILSVSLCMTGNSHSGSTKVCWTKCVISYFPWHNSLIHRVQALAAPNFIGPSCCGSFIIFLPTIKYKSCCWFCDGSGSPPP